MHAPRSRSLDSTEDPVEEWPYLDQDVLVPTRSRKLCMTCHWFRHHAGPNCIPLLSCQLHQGLLARGEHLTSRCQGWTDDLARQRGWAPEGGEEPMHVGDRKHPPPSPKEGWISTGRLVLHFKSLRYERWAQSPEVTLAEVMPGGEPPLLKRRKELTREQAIKLWGRKRKAGWQVCPPQWSPAAPLSPG